MLIAIKKTCLWQINKTTIVYMILMLIITKKIFYETRLTQLNNLVKILTNMRKRNHKFSSQNIINLKEIIY